MLRSRNQLSPRPGTSSNSSSGDIFSKPNKSESPPLKFDSNNEPSSRRLTTSQHHHPFSPSSSSKLGISPSSSSNLVHSKEKSAFRAISTEFQSLKLESMSTVEEYGATSQQLVSALQNAATCSKQYLNNASVSLVDYNDSDSTNSSSGDEQELTQTIFQEQVKFFCQMKDFLLSQQMALRQQLAALNFKVAKKRRPPPRRRRPVIESSNSSSSHIPNISAPNKDDVQEPEIHPDIQQFFSCSSADKSDYFQLCPICGLELETQENPEALEEHVAAHWGSS